MKKLILIAACVAAAACSTLTPAQQSAINTTATVLVDAAKIYQGIGEPGLPTKDQALFAGLSSAASQLQAQVGTPANPTIINTGVPAVDQVVQSKLQAGAIVTQANVNTVSQAAALVAPSPGTSMIRTVDPHYSLTVYRMADRLGASPSVFSVPSVANPDPNVCL